MDSLALMVAGLLLATIISGPAVVILSYTKTPTWLVLVLCLIPTILGFHLLINISTMARVIGLVPLACVSWAVWRMTQS